MYSYTYYLVIGMLPDDFLILSREELIKYMPIGKQWYYKPHVYKVWKTEKNKDE